MSVAAMPFIAFFLHLSALVQKALVKMSSFILRFQLLTACRPRPTTFIKTCKAFEIVPDNMSRA